MRYDRILKALDAAREKYEAAVWAILMSAQKQDDSTEKAVRKLVKTKVRTGAILVQMKTKKRKKLSPEARASLIKNLALARAAKKAKKNGKA